MSLALYRTVMLSDTPSPSRNAPQPILRTDRLFRRPLLTILLASMLSVVIMAGCGSDDEKCRTDFDCETEHVCEPEGCRRACTMHQDCDAPTICQPRRVEEGKTCR